MKRTREKYGYTIFFRHDYDNQKLNDLLASDGVRLLFQNFDKFECLSCGKEFLAQNKGTGTKYCSAKCRVNASRQRLVDRLVEEEIARRKEKGLL